MDDIKKNTHCVLPAVKQLYATCKANRANLSELNKQHEILKLLSTSMARAHTKAEEVSKKLGLTLKSDTLVDGRYTHKEYVDTHLELMMFLINECDMSGYGYKSTEPLEAKQSQALLSQGQSSRITLVQKNSVFMSEYLKTKRSWAINDEKQHQGRVTRNVETQTVSEKQTRMKEYSTEVLSYSTQILYSSRRAYKLLRKAFKKIKSDQNLTFLKVSKMHFEPF